MNKYQELLMSFPSPNDEKCCAICGRSATNLHHIVPRSVGGTKGPVVRLCGSGTTGHHGMTEQGRLHFRFVLETSEFGHWEYLITEKPMKYEDTMYSSGWDRLPFVAGGVWFE